MKNNSTRKLLAPAWILAALTFCAGLSFADAKPAAKPDSAQAKKSTSSPPTESSEDEVTSIASGAEIRVVSYDKKDDGFIFYLEDEEAVGRFWIDRAKLLKSISGEALTKARRNPKALAGESIILDSSLNAEFEE